MEFEQRLSLRSVARTLGSAPDPYSADLATTTDTPCRSSRSTALRSERAVPGGLALDDVEKLGRNPGDGGWGPNASQANHPSEHGIVGLDDVGTIFDRQYVRISYARCFKIDGKASQWAFWPEVERIVDTTGWGSNVRTPTRPEILTLQRKRGPAVPMELCRKIRPAPST